MLLHAIRVKNLLSFGPNGVTMPLRPLNVLIGPNGSGKSNLIEVVGLLQAAPQSFASPIRRGGGAGNWLWKGGPDATAHVEASVENPPTAGEGSLLRYAVEFAEADQRFYLGDERIEDESPGPGSTEPRFYYRCVNGEAIVNVHGQERRLDGEERDRGKSVLSQLKDYANYSEITHLGRQFDSIRIYREWSFGRNTPARQPQKADQRNDFLEEDCTNLGLMLNRLRRDVTAKSRLLEMLARLYPEIQDVDVIVEAGTVQVFLHEGQFSIPATRLSDGTLRYLCLLAILCHPSPPPLVCIEEPELGLHPDALVGIGELLKEASTRTQLIVTTHSEVLVDCFSSSPEDVIVCEKQDGESTMTRLEQPALAEWLKKYSLGQLWRRGEIGGNRW